MRELAKPLRERGGSPKGIPTGLHVLNVQTEKFFAGELIPGSRRVPLDTIRPDTPDLAKDAEIVTYCAGPAGSESIEAARKRTEPGHESPHLP